MHRSRKILFDKLKPRASVFWRVIQRQNHGVPWSSPSLFEYPWIYVDIRSFAHAHRLPFDHGAMPLEVDITWKGKL